MLIPRKARGRKIKCRYIFGGISPLIIIIAAISKIISPSQYMFGIKPIHIVIKAKISFSPG